MSPSRFRRMALPQLDAVFRTARRLSRGHADAEELVEETYRQAQQTAGKTADGRRCRIQLFLILHETWRRLGDRAGVATAAESSHPGRDETEQALRRIPGEFRLPLLLAVVEELSPTEMAEVLGCLPGAVPERVAQGRALLAAELSLLPPDRRAPRRLERNLRSLAVRDEATPLALQKTIRALLTPPLWRRLPWWHGALILAVAGTWLLWSTPPAPLLSLPLQVRFRRHAPVTRRVAGADLRRDGGVDATSMLTDDIPITSPPGSPPDGAVPDAMPDLAWSDTEPVAEPVELAAPEFPTGPPPVDGTIRGVVQWQGPPLDPSTTARTPFESACGPDFPAAPLIRGQYGRLADVYAKLIMPWPPVGERAPELPQEIHLRGCRISPLIARAKAGDSFVVVNDDPIPRTLRISLGEATVLVVNIPAHLAVQKRVFSSGMLQFTSDGEPGLVGYLAVDHPFTAVTGDDGNFTISHVPPGRYVLELWHELLGKQQAEVEVRAGATTPVALAYHDPPPLSPVVGVVAAAERCRWAVRGQSPVAQACAAGGIRQARLVMNLMVNAGRQAGLRVDCDSCHVSDNSFRLTHGAGDRFRDLLRVISSRPVRRR